MLGQARNLLFNEIEDFDVDSIPSFWELFDGRNEMFI